MRRMLGVKVYDPSFCTSNYLDLMQDLGINTVFLGRSALNLEIAEEMTQRGLFWNIVEPVFLIVDDEDCRLATKDDGDPAIDDWVRFACPTDSVHLDRVRSRIESDIRTYNPPGISLDFIRFFQFWEMTVPGTDPMKLSRTCYCSRCRDLAEPFGSESAWRVDLVTNTAAELVALSKSLDSSLKIGIHAVPWTRTLFDGAREKVVGQNFCSLGEICDYLTPMAYHHMIRMPVSYIGDLVRDMADEGCPHIVPSIQSKEAYRTDAMDADEYGKALETALDAPSEGVLIYKWEDLCSDRNRLGMTKAVFRGF